MLSCLHTCFFSALPCSVLALPCPALPCPALPCPALHQLYSACADMARVGFKLREIDRFQPSGLRRPLWPLWNIHSRPVSILPCHPSVFLTWSYCARLQPGCSSMWSRRHHFLACFCASDHPPGCSFICSGSLYFTCPHLHSPASSCIHLPSSAFSCILLHSPVCMSSYTLRWVPLHRSECANVRMLLLAWACRVRLGPFSRATRQ